MYEKFTDCARRIMQLAKEEAQRSGHTLVYPHHILAAFYREGSNTALLVLRDLGMDFDLRTIRSEIEKLAPCGTEFTMGGHIPLAPVVNDLIKRAREKASEMQAPYVGTEHLLLAIFSYECKARDILTKHGVTEEKVKEKILSLNNLIGKNPTPVSVRAMPKYSNAAEDIFERAKSIARAFGHNRVGRLHLLYAFREDRTLAGVILREIAGFYGLIKDILSRYLKSENIPENLLWSDIAVAITKYAPQIALELGHNYVGPEHILLAILRENYRCSSHNFDGAGFFEMSGAGPDDLEKEILVSLGLGVEERQLAPNPKRIWPAKPLAEQDYKSLMLILSDCISQGGNHSQGEATMKELFEKITGHPF